VSARARRARVVVHHDGRVEVVLPRRAARGTAERLLDEHRPWIERQLARPHPRLELPPIGEPEGRRLAREVADELCREHAPRLGVRYERIRIGDQRTRWGSCSPRGTLSFNWRLVLAPAEIFEYVVVHELCHLREPNHSPAFWGLVREAHPGYEEQRGWLRVYGPALRSPAWRAGPRSTATAR
jgi:predicted metal-dependent hydrolase